MKIALRYLNMFTKATPLTDVVTLHLSTEYPLKVDRNLRFVYSPPISKLSIRNT